jgi:hypothetical protein
VGDGYVVEIQRAFGRHSIRRCQNDLRWQATNGSRCWNGDDFVQPFDDFVSREDQNGTTLIGEAKGIPPDLRDSLNVFPASGIPCERFLIIRELVLPWRHDTIGLCVSAGGPKGDQAQESNSLRRFEAGDERN